MVQDPVPLAAVETHAPHGDGDDVRARRIDGAHHRLVVAVLPRAHHEARVEGPAADRERDVPDQLDCRGHAAQPPPTKCTSSIASPGATPTSPSAGRRTIERLCSTTTV